MRLKKVRLIGSAILLSISSLLVVAFPQATYAVGPYTCTWTGGGGDSKFSTAANWSGCNSAAPVPSDGDNLVFDSASLGANASLNNDLTSLQIGSIAFSGTNTNGYGYTLTGNAASISGGITQAASGTSVVNLSLTLTASQTFSYSNGALFLGDSTAPGTKTLALGTNTLTLSGTASCAGIGSYDAITGSGTITDSITNGVTLNADSTGFTGAINVNAGYLSANTAQALGAASATTTVANGASLYLGYSSDTTFPENIRLNGSGLNGYGALLTTDPSAYFGCAGGGGSTTTSTATLTGTITLQSNTTALLSQYHNLTVTGPLSGSFTLTAAVGSVGILSINSSNNTSLTPNGNQTAPAVTTNYTANSPGTNLDIVNNVTGIVDGTYGSVTVESGGTIKGTGTVSSLYVNKGGTVSPGHSPGCLTINGSYTQIGSYQAELGGTTACSGYDQLIVTGTVTLDDGGVPPIQGTLDVSLVNGFKPKAGNTFTIINNQGSQAVTDTYAGLPEGTTFNLSGYVFKITYKGGDGNDVVLTVVSVPATPNTGFAVTSANVMLPLVGSMTAASGLYLVSRRMKRTGSR